jgi:hypothetical protein
VIQTEAGAEWYGDLKLREQLSSFKMSILQNDPAKGFEVAEMLTW